VGEALRLPTYLDLIRSIRVANFIGHVSVHNVFNIFAAYIVINRWRKVLHDLGLIGGQKIDALGADTSFKNRDLFEHFSPPYLR